MHHFLFHEEGTKQKPSRQGTQFDNGEKHLIRGSPWPASAPLGNLFTSYLKFGSVNVHLLPFTRQITIATHYYWGHFSNMASANLL